MRILSLDLGKFKTVFLDYLCGSGMDASGCQFGKVPSTREAIGELLAQRKPHRVVLEAGNNSGWVYDLAVGLGIAVQVVNVNDERWEWRRTKKKRDREDAFKAAHMSELGTLPTIHMPKPQVRQWRALIEGRKTLVERLTAVKNSIRAIFDRQGLALPRGYKAWTQAGLAQLARDAKPLAQCPMEELWRGMVQCELEQYKALAQQIEVMEKKLDEIAQADQRVVRLRTAPSVGPRLAEMVVALLDDPKRFKNGRRVGCYVGLTPRIWQSGESYREGHISRCGNGLLRGLLVEVSWLGVWRGGWMKEVYERVRRGSDKRKKIAIVAVARRLLVRLWAMMRDGTTWREPGMREMAAA
jgi:transposase